MPYKKYKDITLYVAPGLKLCELVKAYFRSNGEDYKEVDISRDRDLAKKMFQISGETIPPVVEIDGRVIVGYRPELYDFILQAKPDDHTDSREA